MSKETVRVVGGDIQAEIDRLVVETAQGRGDWTAEGMALAEAAKLDVEEVKARFTVAREVAEELGPIKSAPEANAREDMALDACISGDDAPAAIGTASPEQTSNKSTEATTVPVLKPAVAPIVLSERAAASARPSAVAA
jgi:hypothetical protein